MMTIHAPTSSMAATATVSSTAAAAPSSHPEQSPPVVPSFTAMSSTTTTTTTTRTILRIKRRRTEHPVASLRLEGVARVPTTIHGFDREDEEEDETLNLEEQNYQKDELRRRHRPSSHHHATSRKRSSAVLWKRFDPEQQQDEEHSDAMGGGGGQQHKYRIVNALLTAADDDNDDTDEAAGDERHSKRRKLTVLDTATTIADSADVINNDCSTGVTSPLHSLFHQNNNSNITATFSPSDQQHNDQKKKKKKHPLKILDPMTRIVDDSLQEVLAGSRLVEAHYQLLTSDTRFTMQDAAQQRTWMTWCHSSGGGNLLHCCALWNDASTAHQLLQQYSSHQGSAVATAAAAVFSSLVETTDADGRTPYEVAQLVGHEAVCQVLEAYGGDTSNYVYDIFYLDDNKNKHNNDVSDEEFNDNSSENDEDDNDSNKGVTILTAELTSGVGYWTPEGELVLEADEKHAHSLSHETDGDIDSNCEEYGANDYPDEEEEEGYDVMKGIPHNHQQHLPWRHDDEDYEEDDDDDCYHQTPYQVNDDDHYDVYDWEDDL